MFEASDFSSDDISAPFSSPDVTPGHLSGLSTSITSGGHFPSSFQYGGDHIYNTVKHSFEAFI
jgi:hypothetical protein